MKKLLPALFCILSLPLAAQNPDVSLLLSFNHYHTPGLNKLMLGFTRTQAEVVSGVPLGLMLEGKLDHQPEICHEGLKSVCSVAGATLISYGLKKIIQRPRPYTTGIPGLVTLEKEKGLSMPSGHTTSTFALCVSLCASNPGKWELMVPALLYASLIGYSRMYVGVHYPSDVLVGALVGTATALVTQKLFNRFPGL